MPHLKARLSVSSVRQLSVHSSDSESNQAKDLRMDDTYRLTRSKREPLDIQPQCVTPAAIARAYSVSALAVVALSKVPLALLTAWSCHYMALRRIRKLGFSPTQLTSCSTSPLMPNTCPWMWKLGSHSRDQHQPSFRPNWHSSCLLKPGSCNQLQVPGGLLLVNKASMWRSSKLNLVIKATADLSSHQLRKYLLM